jgi:hypothetical protein
MKTALIAVLIAGFAAPALAAERVSDVEYLKANRCKGLATTLSAAEVDGFNGFLKAQRTGRPDYIAQRAEDEFDRARREARSADRLPRLTVELSGPCQAYLGGAATMAKQGGPDASKQ